MSISMKLHYLAIMCQDCNFVPTYWKTLSKARHLDINEYIPEDYSLLG
jgi:hypothetical protein